jgi:hypothetical protein
MQLSVSQLTSLDNERERSDKEQSMNIPELEKLVKQYREDKSVIFQMEYIGIPVQCGTAMCIAGQACVNNGWALERWDDRTRVLGWAVKDNNREMAFFRASVLLDLNEEEAELLFNKDGWPEQFRDQPDTPALAADRIQHFIDTNGAE